MKEMDVQLGDVIELNYPRTTIERLLYKDGKQDFPIKVLVLWINDYFLDLYEHGLAHKNNILFKGLSDDPGFIELTADHWLNNEIKVIDHIELDELAHDIFNEKNPGNIGWFWRGEEAE